MSPSPTAALPHRRPAPKFPRFNSDTRGRISPSEYVAVNKFGSAPRSDDSIERRALATALESSSDSGISSGDLTNVESVFREHAGRVYCVARRMLGNDADAEDATQEVLILVM